MIHYKGYIQLFRERLSEKMSTRQSRKVIWDMISTRFLTTVAVEPTFVAFLWHSQTHLHSLSYQFFQLSLKKKENSKPPTMPFKIVACTFPDNLSRNSCIFLSLTCRSIPHRRAHKKGRNSHPVTFHRAQLCGCFV